MVQGLVLSLDVSWHIFLSPECCAVVSRPRNVQPLYLRLVGDPAPAYNNANTGSGDKQSIDQPSVMALHNRVINIGIFVSDSPIQNENDPFDFLSLTPTPVQGRVLDLY